MPLYSEQLHNKNEWFTPKGDVARPSLEWNTRHIALGNQPFDFSWRTEESNADECRIVVHAGKLYSAEFAVSVDPRVAGIRERSRRLSVEFDALSKRWHRDTRHVSLISEKTLHPAYLRIIGMGDSAIPLLLEALRDKPAHWFTALRSTTNADPASTSVSLSMAREAWIRWGIAEGYID